VYRQVLSTLFQISANRVPHHRQPAANRLKNPFADGDVALLFAASCYRFAAIRDESPRCLCQDGFFDLLTLIRKQRQRHADAEVVT
jgi:hypothetical protein